MKRTLFIVAETQKVPFDELTRYCRALQIQVSEHVKPHWNTDAMIIASNGQNLPPNAEIITIMDTIPNPRVWGYHEVKNGVPRGYVKYSELWTMITSHETIETLIDPFADRFAVGEKIDLTTGKIKPRDLNPFNNVRYLVEIAGPVQYQTNAYFIDGFLMSDFVLPAYFDFTTDPTKQYSFTGAIKEPLAILTDGYISYKRLGAWYSAFQTTNGVTIERLRGFENLTGNQKSRIAQFAAGGVAIAGITAAIRANK